MKQSLRKLLVRELYVLFAITSDVEAFAQADPQAALDAGRRALRESGGFWGHPWYDPATDQSEAVRVPAKWNWDWLEEWLEWLEDVFDFSGNWNIGEIFATIGWVLVAVVLGVLAYLIIRAYLNREALASEAATVTAGKTARGNLIDRVEALPVKVRDPHADFLAEAQRHYHEGNLGEAIIYLFSYQLLELDKQNLLRLAKGKTNRQYLREVGRGQRSVAARPLAQLFEQTMLLFEESFFGGRAPGRPAFDAVWDKLNIFHAHLARQPEASTR